MNYNLNILKKFETSNVYWQNNNKLLVIKDKNIKIHNLETNQIIIDIECQQQIDKVLFNKSKSHVFVKYQDKSGQLYDIHGIKLGVKTNNIDLVNWIHNDKYLINYHDHSAQMYSTLGEKLGPKFTGIDWIDREIEGFLFINYTNSYSQLLNIKKEITGPSLENVEDIKWNKSEDKYFIIYKNNNTELYDSYSNKIESSTENIHPVWVDRGYSHIDNEEYKIQIYNNFGNKIGPVLTNVCCIRQSSIKNGGYIVSFYDDTIQLYDSNGKQVGTDIKNVTHCERWNPTNNTFFITSKDQLSTQLYNNHLEKIGPKLKFKNKIYSIKWSPNGKNYIVLLHQTENLDKIPKKYQQYYTYNTHLFNLKGHPIGSKLNNVHRIKWNPNGKYYFTKFHNNKAQIYNVSDNKIITNIKLGLNITWNQLGNIFITSIDNQTIVYKITE